jgi:hypothetical protein
MWLIIACVNWGRENILAEGIFSEIQLQADRPRMWRTRGKEWGTGTYIGWWFSSGLKDPNECDCVSRSEPIESF